MRFKTMATITSLTFIAAGAILIQQGHRLTFLIGLQEPSMATKWMKWRFTLVTFIYLFGAVLAGSGLLIRITRNIRSAAMQTNLSAALLTMNVFLGVIVVKGFGVTNFKFTVAVTSVFFLHAMAYGWLLLRKNDASNWTLDTPIEPSQKTMEESWKQQIQEAAAQSERNRLARELHDSIKQQLFSINVNAATAQARWEDDQTGAKTALVAVRSSVREAMAEMDAMLHNLRPAPLESTGLVDALRQQCESLQYRTGANVRAEIGELPTNQELLPGAQDAVFRIAQEALTNIARHARATNVRLWLHRQTRGDEDTLWLEIDDDGSGFDAIRSAAGTGLANIRSRVLEIGGSLQVKSRKGEGTRLTVRVPLMTNESRVINRDLRVAIVFSLVGFLSGGFGTIYTHPKQWPWLGLPAFLLGAFCCYRAALNIQQCALPPAKILDLKLRLHLARFVVIAAFMWSLVNWLILEFYWRAFTRQVRYPILLAWLLWQCYEGWRIEQNLSIQQNVLSVSDFLPSIKSVHRHISFLLLAAITFVLDMPFFIEYAVFKLAALLLFAYWLSLTSRRLWFRRLMVKR